MNLIFEQSIKEAKPLPDFGGSDAWFVKLTLNGKVHHPKMLSMIKKLDDDKLKSMTTDDYILLAALYCGKGLDKIQVSRFDHLMELGIVKHTEFGIKPENGEIIVAVNDDIVSTNDSQSAVNRQPIDGQSTEAVDWPSTGKDDKKQIITAFIESNPKTTTSQIAQLTSLSPTRARELLKELTTEGVIVKNGNYRYANYSIKAKNK